MYAVTVVDDEGVDIVYVVIEPENDGESVPDADNTKADREFTVDEAICLRTATEYAFTVPSIALTLTETIVVEESAMAADGKPLARVSGPGYPVREETPVADAVTVSVLPAPVKAPSYTVIDGENDGARTVSERTRPVRLETELKTLGFSEYVLVSAFGAVTTTVTVPSVTSKLPLVPDTVTVFTVFVADACAVTGVRVKLVVPLGRFSVYVVVPSATSGETVPADGPKLMRVLSDEVGVKQLEPAGYAVAGGVQDEQLMLPVPEANEPAGQVRQAEAGPVEYVPTGQLVTDEEPGGQNVPAQHAWQTWALAYVPPGHIVHDPDPEAEAVPEGQVMHPLPPTEYVPALQS